MELPASPSPERPQPIVPSFEQAPKELAPERDRPQEAGEHEPSQPTEPVQAPPALALPMPMANPINDSNAIQPAAPAATRTANDTDLIEKVWVDKAKKIVSETKDDPYQQEREVTKLQAEYIHKRYGKEVKLTSD